MCQVCHGDARHADVCGAAGFVAAHFLFDAFGMSVAADEVEGATVDLCDDVEDGEESSVGGSGFVFSPISEDVSHPLDPVLVEFSIG